MLHRAQLALAGLPALAGLLMGCVVGVSSAYADHQPVIVVPGRSDVPVMINGVDVRGAAVHGDWGLYRAGHGSIMIEGVGPQAGPEAWPRGYYPATGHRPAYGRKEVLPPAGRATGPAPSYHRSWSAQSAPGPVTDYAPYNGPAVVGDPRGYRHRDRDRHRDRHRGR